MSGESLLGRAMAEKELGERDAAIGDLNAVLERGKDSPLYWPARIWRSPTSSRARAAATAIGETQRLLADAVAAGMSSDALNQIRLLRFSALAASAGKGGGLSESSRTRSGGALATTVSARADVVAAGLRDRARELEGSPSVARQHRVGGVGGGGEPRRRQQVQGGDSRLLAVLRSTDAGNREHAAEVHHRLGVSYFRLNQYTEAEREFRTFLNVAPQSALAPEAAYLQFRSAEGMYRQNPSPATRDMFVSAIENYVKRYPKHENFYEGAFRWGEILQAERRYQEAADIYAQVKGPPAFEVRAAAGVLQSLADSLSNPPKDADKAWAEGLRVTRPRRHSIDSKRWRQTPSRARPPSCVREPTLAKAMTEAAGPAPRLAQIARHAARFREALPRGDRSPSARRSAAAGSRERPRPLRRCRARCRKPADEPAQSRIRRPSREGRAQLLAHLRRPRTRRTRPAPRSGRTSPR